MPENAPAGPSCCAVSNDFAQATFMVPTFVVLIWFSDEKREFPRSPLSFDQSAPAAGYSCATVLLAFLAVVAFLAAPLTPTMTTAASKTTIPTGHFRGDAGNNLSLTSSPSVSG